MVSGRSVKQVRAHVVSGRVRSNHGGNQGGNSDFAAAPAKLCIEYDPIDDSDIGYPSDDPNGDTFGNIDFRSNGVSGIEYPSDDGNDKNLIDNDLNHIDDGFEPCESDTCRLARYERCIRERLAFAPEIPYTYTVGHNEFLLPPTPRQSDIAAAAAAMAPATTTNRPSSRHTPLGLGRGRRRR